MALNGLYCADVPLSNYSLTRCQSCNTTQNTRTRVQKERDKDYYRHAFANFCDICTDSNNCNTASSVLKTCDNFLSAYKRVCFSISLNFNWKLSLLITACNTGVESSECCDQYAAISGFLFIAIRNTRPHFLCIGVLPLVESRPRSQWLL